MQILIKGAGDLASGIAHRLYQCGFQIVMTETAAPTTVRCTVAFSRAVYEGCAEVEGVSARLAHHTNQIPDILASGEIAVFVDPDCTLLHDLHPDAVVDAILAKRNLGTSMEDAPIVIGVGPGFTAGTDCHAVVETKRGHDLGRVLYTGSAIPNTGIPGEIGGYTTQRIIRACCDGHFIPIVSIGTVVKAGDPVASVDGNPVYASIGGVVRGMLPSGTPVYHGMKSGDIDPRGIVSHCYTISDKARAIGGGVLEALLHLSLGRDPK